MNAKGFESSCVGRCGVVLAVFLALPAPGYAQSTGESRRGMAEIFAEGEICELNASVVRRRAAALSLKERYDYLSDWVLPVGAPFNVRLGIHFTQTDPVPVSVNVSDTFALNARRVHLGGEVVSPALDLIRAASTLGKLNQLQQRIVSIDAINDNDRRCRTALLVAIATEQQEADAVSKYVGNLADGAPSQAINGKLDPGLLFALHCLLNSSLADHSSILELPELLRRVKASGAKNVETRHLRAIIKRLLAVSSPTAEEVPTASDWTSKQWRPVNRYSARSRGSGVNPSLWNIRSGRAENIASHGHDLLYFAVPMQRNVTVEGDVSIFNARDVEFQVAGRWYAPSFTLDKYSTGNIRGARKYHKLPTKMSKAVESVRSQSTVRQGRLVTSFNGRVIDSVTVPDDHDPWVAIHSEQHYEGAARNVHIGGHPVIPESLQLVADKEQSGWVAYYGSSIGVPGAQWKSSPDAKLRRLIGSRRLELQGTHCEELIYYHRPMLEDGTMEVEFFYRENEMLVHPAMDRMCFLLSPDGVKIHWLTDGPFDRTELPPDSTAVEPQCRRGPAELPLKEGQWNTLRLKLAGDNVSLILNGIQVYERDLQVTNQRTFGLFHFADKTEARVRSVVYRGNWSREVPDLGQQELANPVQRDLEEHLASLPVTFEHDFSNGLPKRAFHLTGVDSEDRFKMLSDGVTVVCPGVDDGQWYSSILVPNCELHGDFDIDLRFRAFDAAFSPGGYGSVDVRIALDDEFSTWFTWLRRTEPTKDGHEKNFTHLMASRRRAGKTFHEFNDCGPAEFTGGGLRVARKGETLYFMIAEHDSPFYHVLKKFPVSRGPILPAGIRFLTSSHEAGETRVTFQKIRLRAEKITGLAMTETVHDVTALNEHRSELPVLSDTDCSEESDVDSAFRQYLSEGALAFEENGLRVTASGTKDWTSTSLMAMDGLSGDFDVEVQFDDVEFQRPPPDSESTLYLSLEFEGDDAPEVHCKYAIDPDGNRAAESQRRIRRQDGIFEYREQSVRKTDRMHGLRVARRSGIAYLMFRRDADDPWELLEMIMVGTADVPRQGLQIKLHAAGDGQQTETLLQRVIVRARKRSVSPLGFLRGLID